MIVIQDTHSVHTISGIKAEEWLYDKKISINEDNEQILELIPKVLPEGVKFILDEDSELGKKIIAANFLFEPLITDGKLIDIVPLKIPIDELRQRKLNEITSACEQTIYAGVDAPTSKGVEHFALTLEDQKNMLAQTAVAETGKSVLYHADGKPCRLFEPDEFMAVSNTAFAYITYCTTLCNYYNTWIRRSDDIDEINAIVWGSPLPEGLTNEDGYTFDELMGEMEIPFRSPTEKIDGGDEA